MNYRYTNIDKTALWDVAPCSLVEQTDVSEVRTGSIIMEIMVGVRTSETSVYTEPTSPYMPEGCHICASDFRSAAMLV
jgi:hypothetical protein